jgi:hypothetical protein
MPAWDDEDWDEETDGAAPRLIPLEEELPGSVYFVPDEAWGFRAPHRRDHPGVCVACDVPGRRGWLYKGTDAGAAVVERYDALLVEPSDENGLGKLTAFALEPRAIRLHKILTWHAPPRQLGRLEDRHFRPMRAHFLAIVQANRHGQP